MASFTPDPNAPILVQFAPSPGFDEVSLGESDLQKKSVEAMKNAMNTIYNTARQVTDTINGLEVKPSAVEVEFGIILKGESGALIAKAGAEAAFKVKLTWENK